VFRKIISYIFIYMLLLLKHVHHLLIYCTWCSTLYTFYCSILNIEYCCRDTESNENPNPSKKRKCQADAGRRDIATVKKDGKHTNIISTDHKDSRVYCAWSRLVCLWNTPELYSHPSSPISQHLLFPHCLHSFIKI